MEQLKKKKVAILGLGVEGLSTATYFLKHNIPFTAFDERPEKDLEKIGDEWKKRFLVLKEQKIPVFLGKQITSEDVTKFDMVVRSPGISLKSSFLKDYTGLITSHMKLFFDACPAKIVGVTGTKGKGTTSSLIYEMLKKAGFDAYLGGNIGKPPLSFLDTVTAQSIVVLELSSFQLEDLERSPHIAVMLMVTQEHLDGVGNQNFHESLEEYRKAKGNIVAFQKADDMAILNTDYEGSRLAAERTPAKIAWVSRYNEVENGCFVENNEIILRSSGTDTKILDAADVLLPGGHNLENICAAAMSVYTVGVSISDIAFVARTFKGLTHRLELVREVNGVRYYDDSFSTTPETAIAAIAAFKEPEIVILGGSSKKSDFSELGKLLSGPTNVKIVIGIGVEWPKIKEKIHNPQFEIVEGLKTMKEIVAVASKNAKKGDVVLLSPACASFDMFANYKDRGNKFKEQVNLL